MEIIIQEKAKAMHEILTDSEVGAIKMFAWETRRTVRGAISDKIKNDLPDYQFTTQKVDKEGVKYLQVRRIK